MGEIEMKTVIRKLWTVFPSLVAAAAIVAVGCSQETSRKDVAKAQNKLDKERQQTAETMRDAQRDVADAQQKAQPYTASKPVANDVADAKVDAAQDIAKQKEKEREAAAKLKDTQQNFQASQERDAFVKDTEMKLAETDKQIDALKQKASNAQGAEKDAINREIDMLKTKRDVAKKALNDLKGADIANWKNHQEPVRVALHDLDNSMRNVR
jgi:chromosome segregation ATPase